MQNQRILGGKVENLTDGETEKKKEVYEEGGEIATLAL